MRKMWAKKMVMMIAVCMLCGFVEMEALAQTANQDVATKETVTQEVLTNTVSGNANVEESNKESEELKTAEVLLYATTVGTGENINVEGTYEGTIAVPETYNVYYVTLPLAGMFSIEMTSQMPYYCINVCSMDGTVLWGAGPIAWNSNIEMITKEHKMHLTAGEYYIAVGSYSIGNASGPNSYTYYTGSYSMKTSLTAAGENFAEPNNDFASATPIRLNSSVVGQMALNDDADYFVFDVKKPGKLTWDVTSYIEYYSMYLYNSSGNLVWRTESNAWNADLKKIENTYAVDLAPDTYYLLFKGKEVRNTGGYTYYYEYQGNYDFDMTFASAGASYTTTDDDFASAYNFTLGKKITGHIAINDTQDIMTFTLSRAEEICFNMTSYMAQYNLCLYDSTGKQVLTTGKKGWNPDLGYITNEHGCSLEAGTYYLKVLGEGATGKYVIKVLAKTPLTDTKITKISNQVYTGKAITPNTRMTYQGKKLVKDTDCTVQYKNNTNAGVASVTFTGIGKYTGTKTLTFKIIPISISKASLSNMSAKTYTGNAIKPAVTLKFNNKKLKANTDYTVSYKNNQKTGTATVTIKGKGNFKGTRKTTFKIVPKKVTISKATSSKDKTAKVTWKKSPTVSGYEIYRSTRKDKGYQLVKTINKGDVSSYIDVKVTEGTTYYYKIRAYKTENGKKLYGSYSNVKSVKIKYKEVK